MAIGLWYSFEYEIYATFILVTSLISIFISLIQTRQNQFQLRDMAKFVTKVNRIKNGQAESVNSDVLLPGDLVEIDLSQVIPCDMLMIEGTCTVDETMLTGESAPVTKSALETYETQSDIFDPIKNKLHTSHILSGGTTVV